MRVRHSIIASVIIMGAFAFGAAAKAGTSVAPLASGAAIEQVEWIQQCRWVEGSWGTQRCRQVWVERHDGGGWDDDRGHGWRRRHDSDDNGERHGRDGNEWGDDRGGRRGGWR